MVRPVWPAEVERRRRLEKIGTPPDPPPSGMMPSSVAFSRQELGEVARLPVAIPVPPLPTLSERVRLDRPFGNIAGLVSTVMVGTVPPQWVTSGAYLDAVRGRFLATG
ncbi:MAG TPA: hypothetical protein VI248_29570 [Kineosporiaceae bacterium]